MIKKWIAYNTAKRRERELEKARKNISLQTDKLARDIVARHSRGSVAIQIGSVITKDEMENLLKKYF
ncbi:hypothetical protein [Cognatishimia sp.]|uniref:hypothetical protein n=1 Tax=Cognatishimia sp. TaxID=2211648 RepID=UPI003511F69B|nr:hypothetical protein [Cognatishimia sp.]